MSEELVLVEEQLRGFRVRGPSAGLRRRIVRQVYLRGLGIAMEAMAAILVVVVAVNIFQMMTNSVTINAILNKTQHDPKVEEITHLIIKMDIAYSEEQAQKLAVRYAGAGLVNRSGS